MKSTADDEVREVKGPCHVGAHIPFKPRGRIPDPGQHSPSLSLKKWEPPILFSPSPQGGRLGGGGGGRALIKTFLIKKISSAAEAIAISSSAFFLHTIQN